MKTIKSSDAAGLVRRRVVRGVTAAAVGVVVAFGTGPMSAAFAD
ncbi:hypothetical protein [Saccharopolyspora hattusasensis]